MATVLLPSIEQLEYVELQAWSTYAQAVHNPLEAPERVKHAFEKANEATDMVLEAQHHIRAELAASR